MISIIGAGPSGAYLGSLLGDRARVFEEHSQIGKPIQCTGILTRSIKELIDVKDEFVVNKINRIKLISPNNKEYEFKLKDKEYIVDRCKFDTFLVNKAIDNGAKVFTNHKLLDYEIKENIKLKFKDKEIETDFLVGADGPNSLVARKAGLLENRKYKVGHQYTAKGEYDPEVFTVYFNGVKSYFGWVVPESKKIARVGIVGDSNIPNLFNEFLKKINIDKKYFIECQSGSIPVYDHNSKWSSGKVYVVGDAAGHVKATTLGGIVYGMRASKILAKVLTNGGNYEKEFKRQYGKSLKLHSKTNEFLSEFSAQDFDKFVSLLKKVNLGEFNRDNPFSGLPLFLKPSLMFFLMRKYFQNKVKI